MKNTLLSFSLILFSFISCNSSDESHHIIKEDAIRHYKLNLAREGKTLKTELKRGVVKTVLEFPKGGTETNLVINKNGIEIARLDYFMGDTSNSNQFVILTDSSNINKTEVYNASYLSCSQFGSYTIVIN